MTESVFLQSILWRHRKSMKNKFSNKRDCAKDTTGSILEIF